MSDVTFSLSEPEPKRGPGRPPKSATKPTGRPTTASAQQKATVEAALASMNGMYSLLSLGAVLIRRKLTAEYIATQIDQWQAGNKEAFQASPKLASVIAGIGQGSGVMAFVMVNGMAAFNIARALREEGEFIREQAKDDAAD